MVSSDTDKSRYMTLKNLPSALKKWKQGEIYSTALETCIESRFSTL